MNPFIERIQIFMDRSFEAGLPRAWNNFYSEELLRLVRHNDPNVEFRYDADEKSESLSFSQILPIFGILSIGFVVAGFVFLLDIFHYDFVSEISFLDILMKIRDKIYKMSFKSKKKTKIVQTKEALNIHN